MEKINCKICQHATDVYLSDLFDDRYGYPGLFTVYRCPNCGFGQTVPELTGQELGDLYTNYYPRKDITAVGVQASIGFRPGRWFRWMSWWHGTNNTCHWHIQPGTKVLDIGCGSGVSLLEIQAQGADAYGTEEDRNVEKMAQALNLKIHFGGNLTTAGYADGQFDVITMSQLLEHISDPAAFLRTVCTKLKPTGQVIMSFPNIDGFNQRRNGRTWINWHMPFHVNFFTRQSIAQLAEQSGFTVQRIQTITPNVWLQLQIQANAQPAQLGKPNIVWTTSTVTATETIWQRRWRVGKALLQSWLRIPITRWHDAHGKGDSWLVIMTPKT